jgi:hypothetical protein
MALTPSTCGRVEQAAVAQQQAGVAILEHVGQAFGRVIDVQRHIGAAGLEDGQQADQQCGERSRAMATQVSGPTPLSRR